ncbi:hypothetical protein R3W88_019800 [Solanum pinnatisectum]|uniref:DUF4283 domain-containing protein n=1 Tax=Solanum pinnatisectum TaxID=50273 RepID=A0AAV9KLX0_9SOLN|nr:hypothetical protein R3W88_019800 [Solanum pinnatisectum]
MGTCSDLICSWDSPTIAFVERYIVLQVNTVSKPMVYYHDDRYFLVRFPKVDDRNELFYSRPHLMNNFLIIVKVWSPKFDFNKEVLQIVPICVKYPNLPLDCWSMDLGLCTTKVDQTSFARVLIEMDVSRELPKKMKLEDPNDRVFEQIVQYEWVPKYCDKCMQEQLAYTVLMKNGFDTLNVYEHGSTSVGDGRYMHKEGGGGLTNNSYAINHLEH